ncbi:hypothetical protein AB0D49_36340 [Streptomyces sp. NPDC048290]|uniref:hypothetical protein n=1 Tax=Streptomyces sp. NPDC048290 TaxID=3155811 RepID=UPI00342E4676
MPLTDDCPVLLGPLRLETRFRGGDLLLRVFPDEWCVRTEETLPGDAEFAALTAYWTALWRAAGRPAAERAAWQELTGRVAVGRAAWLVDTFPPADPGDRPTGVPDETAVLVVVSDSALPAEDRAPTVAHWSAVWRAHGDRVRLRAADTALLAAVGATRAAAIRARPPSGVEAAPVTPYDGVVVAFLVVPRPPETAADSWTTPAKAVLLPDRFTAYGYLGDELVLTVPFDHPLTDRELAVGPDPGAGDDQLRLDEDTGVLTVPDALKWLVDFDAAVTIGMGQRIPLDARTRGGLDRLVVLGLREDSTAAEGARDYAELITRQLRSPAGFALLPQGTPTNNTSQAPAGPDEPALADAGLRALRHPFSAAPGDWRTRTDGQCFADLLGLDPAVLRGLPGADGTDQRDARAAQTALWPATWGAYLGDALHPLLDAGQIAATRDHFVRYVSGRGPLPAVRVGRQPYGILPTTAFSRLPEPADPWRRALARVLDVAEETWRDATARVARVLAPDETPPPGYDPHQRLLDVLALHPSSVEYHQRYALGVEDYYNRENLAAAGPDALALLRDGLGHPGPLADLLARLGHAIPGDPLLHGPELIRRLFSATPYPLLGPLVDDRPLSETDPVRPYLPGPDGLNYLHWLADTARRDLDALRLEDGFLDGRPPAAVLYLLLRHALVLGWEDAGRRLAVTAGRDPAPPVDPPFVHVRLPRQGEPAPPSESRWRQLYAPDPQITGSPDTLVHQYIPGVLGSRPETAALAEQADAVALLADLPTARLERVLAEHLDCAGHRLDAWRLAQANELLTTLRHGPDGTAPTRPGLHLGAYGWLERLRPRQATATRTEAAVPEALTGLFDATALPHDTANGGWIHAPSPAHARTAAVLRAGYLADGAGEQGETFAVDLSSERVRRALALLDGLRQGQSLGALLGYRFERGLHEDHPGTELDRFLPALRGAFPLRAGKLSGAPTPDGTDLVEARNVVDGLALVRRATRGPDPAPQYPYGAPGLPDASPDERAAMDQEVGRLLDLHDALADLAVAEGTHQALLGNPERASATLDAYAKDGFPPDPAVVRTPRGGVTLTHRLGLLLTPGLRPGSATTATPRAQAEPAVDAWLAALLPRPQDIAVRVTWTDPADGRPRDRVVTQRDLGLRPVDLLWALRPAGSGTLADLDDRITGQVVARDRPRPDTALTIRHTERVPGRTTLFEVSALVDTLRTLLTTARPLRPTDLAAPAGPVPVDAAADDAVSVPRERPEAVRDALGALAEDTDDLIAGLAPLLPDPPADPDRAALLTDLDDFLARHAGLAASASGFGMVRSGWTEAVEWRRAVSAELLAAVAVAAARMTESLARADALIETYDDLPPGTPDAQRFSLLEAADQLLTTTPASPRPDTPTRLRTTVALHRLAFDRRLDGLDSVADTRESTLSGLLAEVGALLPLTDLDPIGLDITPYQDRSVAFLRDLLARARTLRAETADRLTAADLALTAHDQAVTGPDRATAARDALTALLGPDALVVPEFTPSDALADEWRAARGDSARLTAHLTAAHDHPLDDWVHQLARVREKPRLWEKTVHLADALRGPGGLLGDADGWEEPRLTPVQFPHREDDTWLGLEFAPGTEIDQDRLLFTAHYAGQPLLGDGRWCGLLLDEWTEVIPAAQETTGIAVHYDGPAAEPPQALLLVVPPERRPDGLWRRDDLLAAVTETFALARIRGVEPHHLDDTPYAHLLPATLLSATRQPITPATDLALANLRGKAPAAGEGADRA